MENTMKNTMKKIITFVGVVAMSLAAFAQSKDAAVLTHEISETSSIPSLDEKNLVISGSTNQPAKFKVTSTYESTICKMPKLRSNLPPKVELKNREEKIVQDLETTNFSYSLKIPFKLFGICDFRLTYIELSYSLPSTESTGVVKFIVNHPSVTNMPPLSFSKVEEEMILTCAPRNPPVNQNGFGNVFYLNCDDPTHVSRPPIKSLNRDEGLLNYRNDQLYISTDYKSPFGFELHFAD